METKTFTQDFDVDEFIDRLRRVTGCSSDQELSRYFGFSVENQFASYRSRGKISTVGFERIMNKLGNKVNINWLFYGTGDAYTGNRSKGQYSDALYQMLMALGIEADSPEAKSINDRFLQVINKEDSLPEEVRRAELNKFLGNLFNYILTKTSDT